MGDKRGETSPFEREGPGISTEHFPKDPLGGFSNACPLYFENQLRPIAWAPPHAQVFVGLHDTPSRNLVISRACETLWG